MKQQIIIGGLGGQGVLFTTRILAETALKAGFRVFVSETHGMAQRGGNVISHLKVFEGDSSGELFYSPLVRPGKADLLIALHPESGLLYRHFLKPDGKLVCNGDANLDATSVACKLGNPVLTNIITTGYAAALGYLFCDSHAIRTVISEMGGSGLENNLRAFDEGVCLAEERKNAG